MKMLLGLTAVLLMPLSAASPGSLNAQPVNRETDQRCNDRGTSVLILLSQRVLLLCRDGETEGEYTVSLGKGGVGKRKSGDNKTPVGTYGLGLPRPSEKFGKFIPIGYPTEEQRLQGFTGQAIGIHGPDRRFTWAGWLNTVLDWTQGCIAVRSDDAIDAIADWVRRKKVKIVNLVDTE